MLQRSVAKRKSWEPSTPPDEHIAWVRDSWNVTRPFSTGGNYVNFQLAEDDVDRTAAAYRENYERLQTIKVEYDPDNLFRVNRNISSVSLGRRACGSTPFARMFSSSRIGANT